MTLNQLRPNNWKLGHTRWTKVKQGWNILWIIYRPKLDQWTNKDPMVGQGWTIHRIYDKTEPVDQLGPDVWKLGQAKWPKAGPYLGKDIQQNWASGQTGTNVWKLGQSKVGQSWAILRTRNRTKLGQWINWDPTSGS